MSISITDRTGLMTAELRELLERRLTFALSRFESHVEQVVLVINDENGPRGGMDKACRVSIKLHRAADVIITDRDGDIGKCVSRIADRAGRAVSKSIAKSQEVDRSRPVLLDAQIALDPTAIG